MAKTKKTNLRAEEIFKLIDKSGVPECIRTWVKKDILECDKLGFFWKAPAADARILSDNQILKCMACGHESEKIGLRHLSDHVCDNCHTTIKIRNRNKIKSFHKREWSCILSFQAIEEAVVMRVFKTDRIYGGRYNPSDRLITQTLTEIQRTILFDGAVYDYISKDIYECGNKYFNVLCLRQSKVYSKSPHYCYLTQSKKEIADEIKKAGYPNHIFLEELDKFFKKEENRKYKNVDTLTIKAYRLFLWPKLEYIYRCGYKRLYDEYLNGLALEDKSLNLYQKKVNGILGVPQSILKNYGHETLESRDIKAIKQIIGYGKLGQLTPERFEFIRNNCICHKNSLGALDVFKDFGLEKVINYIKKIAEGDGAACGCHAGGYGKKTYSQVYKDFLDYRNELHELGYDMTDEATMLPRDLYKAHTRTSLEIIELKEKSKLEDAAKNDIKFKKAVKKYIEQSAVYGNFIFGVATSGVDIIKEGRILGHCVHGYGERIIGKRAVIFFVRKIDEPDIPLYTLEYNPKTGNIVQLRGKCNALAPEPIQKLAKQYIAGIAQLDGFTHKIQNLRAQG